MPGELSSLEFALDDTIGGQRLTPETVDEQALEFLWRKGRVAWRDVRSAAEWVEALRGNKPASV
jgi:hypothetical protein